MRHLFMGAGLILLAHAAAAQDRQTSTACDAVHDGLDAYEAAFEADGWSRVEGEDRADALAWPTLILGFVSAMPGASADASGVAALRAAAEASGREMQDDALVFARDNERAAVQVLTTAGEGDVIRCVLAAAVLPEVRTLIDTGGALQTGDLQIVPSLRDPKPGETATATNGIRLAPQWAGAETLDGIVMSHTLVIGDGTS